MRRIALVALLLAPWVALPGCSSGGPPLSAEPSHASMFGDTDVTLSGDLRSLGAIREVTIGGVRALDVRTTDRGVVVHVQGAPVAGPAELRIVGANGVATDASAFRYDAPDVPLRWMAFGASLTEGMQSSGLDARGQLRHCAGARVPFAVVPRFWALLLAV